MRIALSVFLAFICCVATARDVSNLNAGWFFKKGEVEEGRNPALDTTAWQTLSLPHSWGWEEAQRGSNYYRGPGWYRKELNVAPVRGKRYFVRFGAAGSVADVYVNGRHIGQHRGAFGAFCYEITRALTNSGSNVLAVRVSNAVEPDIAPLSGDFCVFGGLYRNAELIETADVNFTPTDHGSPGVAWLQTRVSETEAILDVTAQVSNGTRSRRPVTFTAVVLDRDGNRVASAEQALTLVPNDTVPLSLRLTVPQPHLWNGIKDPYLYRAIVELRSADGVVDSVEQPLGLRFYAISEKGFFLNGKPYHLHGANRHQDRLNQGWALSAADEEEDLKLILEMGSTVVRCAHYQHSDSFYSLCDKAGLLVWAEIPQVDRIGSDPRFAETSRKQLTDLIRQNINHPSIFAWSLYNELRPNNPDPHRLLQDLHKFAKAEDPTRPTIAATCTEQLPQMNTITDWLGWNIYPGWYQDWPLLEELGKVTDDRRFTSRDGLMCMSEYGAGANVFQHEDNAKPPLANGQWHPEEYQNIFHEHAWAELEARPWVWGTFVWVMFDFTSYWRKEGGVPGRNDKGLVTGDRQIKKDAFYFYKANWTGEPMVYITSRRFTERTNAVIDVKVYSNAKAVELALNGKSFGSNSTSTNGVFLWKNVQLQPGENKVQARVSGAHDEVVWKVK